MTRTFILLTSLLWMNAGVAEVPATVRADARAGRVDAAVSALQSNPSADAQSLLCELYASVAKRDEAIRACEAAAAAAPNKSAYALALARVYGAKAEHSGAFTGMRMVGKIRGSFERAVQLDGKNVEALSDLGEFYVSAPSIAGGGLDKARPLVSQLMPISPARSHRLAAMIALKEHNDALAEQEYRAELAALKGPEAYVDLANFYRGRKQWDRSEENALAALKSDTAHASDTIDAARVLIDLKRSAVAAQAGLRDYIATPQRGDVGRQPLALTLLGESLAASGAPADAQKQYATALQLAHDYDRALKGAGR